MYCSQWPPDHWSINVSKLTTARPTMLPWRWQLTPPVWVLQGANGHFQNRSFRFATHMLTWKRHCDSASINSCSLADHHFMRLVYLLQRKVLLANFRCTCMCVCMYVWSPMGEVNLYQSCYQIKFQWIWMLKRSAASILDHNVQCSDQYDCIIMIEGNLRFLYLISRTANTRKVRCAPTKIQINKQILA